MKEEIEKELRSSDLRALEIMLKYLTTEEYIEVVKDEIEKKREIEKRLKLRYNEITQEILREKC